MIAERKGLTKYAWLSIVTAFLTIGLKVTAYLMTGSVGLLSDALESGVNLVAAVLALVSLTVAAQPPDEEHAFGHDKVEYFASGAEGTLILIAAGTIAYSTIRRLLEPMPLEQLDVGLAVSVLAAVLNLIVGRFLLHAGKKYRSITLEADANHLLTDVRTTVGVLIGLVAVSLTDWHILDPLIALLVTAQVVWSGFRLVQKSVLGLMDTALPPDEVKQIVDIIEKHAAIGVGFHALRTRQSGAQRFMTVHIQVPGDWSVQRGHTLLEEIEQDVYLALRPISVVTHLEPLEDPSSWEDIELNRENVDSGIRGLLD
jgi:cation diffusion facilitator family transporter